MILFSQDPKVTLLAIESRIHDLLRNRQIEERQGSMNTYKRGYYDGKHAMLKELENNIKIMRESVNP